MKPILCLDVDGVLNVATSDSETISVPVELAGRTVTIRTTRMTIPFMHWAWRNFEMYWLSAWRENANAIADWAQLRHIPVLHPPADYKEFDWKLAALIILMNQIADKDRKFVWIEDGFFQQTYVWAKDRQDVMLVDCDSALGVQASQIMSVGNWAGVTEPFKM